MPESYQPGLRSSSKTFKRSKNHQISDERVAWAITEPVNAIIYRHVEGKELGDGDDVVIMLPKNKANRSDFTISLTNCTMQELEALKEIIDTAFELAEPVVKRRDKEAQDAWDNGDDSFVRIYRPVPQVVFRKGSGREYRQGVRSGLKDSPSGNRPHSSWRTGGTSDELAEPEPQEGVSEDDGPKAG